MHLLLMGLNTSDVHNSFHISGAPTNQIHYLLLSDTNWYISLSLSSTPVHLSPCHAVSNAHSHPGLFLSPFKILASQP